MKQVDKIEEKFESEYNFNNKKKLLPIRELMKTAEWVILAEGIKEFYREEIKNLIIELRNECVDNEKDVRFFGTNINEQQRGKNMEVYGYNSKRDEIKEIFNKHI